ncbi:DMT family transporter [Hasllibacter sp. MH4015]|uniref:DMT family transporter n=1 Tax=Hasllibacter sp. MH4015 TaxID=2854029 RepID=UPI001CD47DDB|nr:DMT family transporter [Hasllibacter sp. MH4015]
MDAPTPHSATLRALPLMLVAMAFIPAGDSAGKLLTDELGVAPVFVAWTRFALGALMIAPFAWSATQARLFTDWRVWLRALMLVGGITSILTALGTEPVANVFGAFFVGPIVSWLLSVWLLREPFSARRLGLICLGFVGVILVVKPGFGMTPGLGFAVLAGLFYGLYLVMSRWMADVAPPRALLLSQLAIGGVVLALPGLLTVPEITGRVAVLTLVSAFCSMAGNFLLIIAYRWAQASHMAPFVYTQLIWATLFGWVIFATLPDGLSLVGLALLVASGLASLAVRRG